MYTILLVDDEPAAISLEKRMIEKQAEGFAVCGTAYSAQDALTIYKEIKPDVVVTDIKMPQKSGVDLIRELMRREHEDVICVAVSGFSDFDYVHDAFACGAFDYLLKPVDGEKVKAVFREIRRLLDERAAKEEVTEDTELVTVKRTDSEIVDEINKYVRENLSSNNSIMTICTMFGINQPYLSRVYKSEMNCTYNEFLTNTRIEEAKRMIRSGRYSMRKIADDTGFSNQFYFSRVFKNVTGLTPTEYAKSVQ